MSELVWGAQAIRFTAFPGPAVEFGEPDWWRTLTGRSSDTRLNDRRVGTLAENGLVDGTRLVLNLTPQRIDWFFQAPDLVGSATIGTYQDAMRNSNR